VAVRLTSVEMMEAEAMVLVSSEMMVEVVLASMVMFQRLEGCWVQSQVGPWCIDVLGSFEWYVLPQVEVCDSSCCFFQDGSQVRT